jgi:uncharacterized protein (DUF1330 family)
MIFEKMRLTLAHHGYQLYLQTTKRYGDTYFLEFEKRTVVLEYAKKEQVIDFIEEKGFTPVVHKREDFE